MKLHILGARDDFTLHTGTHLFCAKQCLCQRTISHAADEQRQSQNRPCFPRIPSSTWNEWRRSGSAIGESRLSPVSPPRWCVWICSACALVPARAVHVGREPCAPVPGPAPNQYVLASKPTPHSGTDDSSKSSQIFNSSVPRDFPAAGAEGTEC